MMIRPWRRPTGAARAKLAIAPPASSWHAFPPGGGVGAGQGWARPLLAAALAGSLLTSVPPVGAIFTDSQSVPGNTVSSGCFHAAVNSVQTGTATNTANGTQTVAITAVDPAKAFLQFSSSSNSNRPVGSTVGGRLASGTSLEFIRATDEASPATVSIRWSVTEYSCGVSVQRGTATQSATTTNVPVTAVPSRDQAFFTFSKITDSSEATWGPADQTVGEMTSTSNLQFRSQTAAGGGAAAGWYSTAWSYRRAVTIDATKVGSGGATNYPALISVTDQELTTAAAKVLASGDDMLFTSADGTTKLSHEIETYTPSTGKLDAWVKVPTLSSASNTTVYLYYGNTGATNQQNPGGVWDTSATWHLDQTPATPFADSSASANTATPQSMAAGAQVAGKVGGSVTLDGVDDYISSTTAFAMGGLTTVTVEAWVKTTSTLGKKVLGFENAQTGNAAVNYDRQLWVGTDGKARFGNYNGATREIAVSSGVVNNGAWHHVVGYRDAASNTIGLYVDGVAQATVATTGVATYTGYLRMGSYAWTGTWTAGAAGFFAGSLDEVRIQNSVRNQAWVTTTYNNINSPSTFASLGSEEARWYDLDWAHRKLITIDNTKLTGPLTNFPMLVSRTTDSGLAASAQADGDDILFTAANGKTKLDHEVEKYTSATGLLAAWVEVPAVSDTVDTRIWMYYGNATVAAQENPTGVWGSSPTWHLGETPTATLADSSSAANNGTPRNMVGGAQVAGKAGGSLTLDGTDDYVSTTTAYTMASVTSLTVEAWVKTAAGYTGGKKVVGFEEDQTGTASCCADRQLYVGTDGKARFTVYSGAPDTAVSTTSVNDGNWHHLVAYRSGTTIGIYVDGVAQGTDANPSVQAYTGYLRMGSHYNNNPSGLTGYFTGGIDEVRWSTTVRTPQWVKANYNSVGSPTTFYALGAEQDPVVQSHTIYWQVVAFTNPSDISVQRGTTSLAIGAPSAAVTINAIDRGRTFSQVSFSSSGTGATIGRRLLQARLTATTTLTIDRQVTGDPIESIAWQVVELRDGSRVQSGQANMANAVAQVDTTLTAPVDTTRATAFTSVDYGGGSAMGSGTYVAGDILGVGTATVTVTSATNVRVTRANSSLLASFGWYVVEWGGPTTWNAAYGERRRLTVSTTTAAPTSYTVSLTIDHATMAADGQSLSSGNDVRVARYNGTTWTELDRVVDDASTWNNSATKLWFRTQTAIAANTADYSYYLYFANPAAGNPPVNKSNVYLFADGFETGSLTNWTAQTAGTSNPFTVASDQARTGTYSAKGATNTSGDDWITANGLSTETGLRIDGFWRASAPATLGAAFGVRSGSTAVVNQYELYHPTAGGWQVAKTVAGVGTAFSSVAEGSCLVANTWTKLSMLVQSNQVRSYCGGVGLAPAAAWHTDAGNTFATGTASILNRYLAGGQNWWVDDVTVRRLVDAEPVVTAPTIPNLGAGQPITGSTEESPSHAYAMSVDDDLNTYWESGTGFPQTLTVDLGVSRTVSRVVLRLPPDPGWGSRTQTLSVLGSPTGAVYTTISPSAVYTFDASISHKAEVTFPATSARYVRVNFTANSVSTAAQVSEFEVYEY